MDQDLIEVKISVVALDMDEFINMLKENGFDCQAKEVENQFNDYMLRINETTELQAHRTN